PTPLNPHSRRFCSTLQPSLGSLRPAAHSRIPSPFVSEAEVIVGFRYEPPGGSAVLLHPDAQESLERRRDSLSEKEPSPPSDPQPGRSCTAHRCRWHSLPSHSAHDALRYRPAAC